MVLILPHVAYKVVTLVHGPEVEEDVWVEGPIYAKLSAKVRLGLLYIEAELVTGAHRPDPLLADKFRCLIYILSSESSLDDFRGVVKFMYLIITHFLLYSIFSDCYFYLNHPLSIVELEDSTNS